MIEFSKNLETIHAKKGFICDMDGVIYHGSKLLEGVDRFLAWVAKENKQFLFLTNSSERSPVELSHKLKRLGLDIDPSHFYTSALATASFLASQCPGGSAYVIGEPGLTGALYDAGITMNDYDPDYVVVGESRSYSFEKIEHAIHLVLKGAKLIGTNTDLTGPSERGILPACRSLTAPIELATGRNAYFIGKPNPIIMRHAMRKLGTRREETAIIGDRMDTDILSGIQTEIDTILVLSGVTGEKELMEMPYRPSYILPGVGHIPPQ